MVPACLDAESGEEMDCTVIAGDASTAACLCQETYNGTTSVVVGYVIDTLCARHSNCSDCGAQMGCGWCSSCNTCQQGNEQVSPGSQLQRI